MTRAATITYSCALFIGFLAGFIFEFRYAMQFLPDYDLGTQMAAAQAVDDFGRTQSRHAGPDASEKSVELCAALMEKLQRRNPSLPEQLSLVDAYIRLAVLADHKRKGDQSRYYMEKAQQAYKSLLLARPISDAQLKAGLIARDSVWDP